MKQLIFVVFLTAFSAISANAQKCDLEIFSEGYEKFNLYLNGIAQSDTPKTYYEFFEIPHTYYEAMITFPNEDDTLIKPLSLSPNTKTIYAIVYKEKREKFKIKFRDQTGLNATTLNLQPNSSSQTTQQESVLRIEKPNPNCQKISGGFNEMEQIRIRLNTFNYDEEKLNYLKDELQQKCFLAIHLFELLTYIENENYRLNAALFIKDHTYDIENSKVYVNAFATNEFRQQYLNSFP